MNVEIETTADGHLNCCVASKLATAKSEQQRKAGSKAPSRAGDSRGAAQISGKQQGASRRKLSSSRSCMINALRD
jgi:hypothetical protein